MTPGEVGKQLAELIAEERAKFSGLGLHIIDQQLLAALGVTTPVSEPPTGVEPMTDADAKRFGLTPMQFGKKYIGQTVDSVPLDYLVWMADESRKTWRTLHAYLNSPRIKRERDAS